MKKIALDLDGVVFDSETLYRVYSEMYDADYYHKDKLIDNSQRTFQRRYDWNKEAFEKFYESFSEKILVSANIMSGADIVLNKLKNNYEFIIITARNDFETDIAVEKLKKVGIDNIKIFNNELHKIARLLDEKVDYVIEDDDDTCIKAAERGIKALYLKNNASNPVNKNGVINVNNWGEIYKHFVLYENN